MRFVIFLSVLAAAWAVPDECDWGESYWCSDLRIAHKCEAVQHCTTSIWKNEKLQADDSEVCTFCETVISDVRKLLEDEAEQKLIKQYLEAACTIIPSQMLAAECKDMVDNYLDVILALVASELDPQSVCATMKLCSGFSDKVTHVQIQQSPVLQGVQDPDICTDCKKFFQDMKEMMTSPAMEKELEQYLDGMVCAQLGSLEDTCKKMVQDYVPTLLQLVVTEFDPAEICGSFGFCNSSFTPANLLAGLRKYTRQQKQVNGEQMCTVCKDIFGVLTLVESRPEVQKAIEDFIKSHFCANLGDLKSTCEASVAQYAPILFDLIFKELNADKVCEELHVCNSSSESPGRQFVSKPQPPKDVKTSAECILCEFIMKELDSMLVANATQEEIIATLEKVCDALPDTISLQCKDFIKMYGPAVLAILKTELDPAVVCGTLGLCSQQRVVVLKASGSGSEECGVCETVIQYMESLMEENSTVQELETLADKICNFLPKQIQNDCDGMISKYAPSLIHYITELVDPNELCTMIGLCKNQTVLKKSTYVGLTRLVSAIQQPSIQMKQSELLGKNECTWGPSHWCKSMENAKKCNTVEHCTKNVWSKNLD